MEECSVLFFFARRSYAAGLFFLIFIYLFYFIFLFFSLFFNADTASPVEKFGYDRYPLPMTSNIAALPHSTSSALCFGE